MNKISPYKLYELSVQSPNWQVDYLPQFHEWLTQKKPLSFREDFCGSGAIACEWVKRSKKNFAWGLDLDEEVLHYAKTVNQAALKTETRKRLRFIKQNVLKPTLQKFDMIGAYNFSYCVFHERKEMLTYAKSVLKSLNSSGTFFLEVPGGPGFQEENLEKKKIKIPGLGTVIQAWEQHQYDPITHINDFSIHFKLPGKPWMNDVFTYHWRIWSVRELREILIDAGFKKTVVLWESADSKGEGAGEYLPLEHAENTHSFVAYVVAVR